MATIGTLLEIPCCICGTMILPNAANQCPSCLAQDFDLKSLMQRGPGGGDIIIHQCRQCRRFERNERTFEYLEIESPELLALCLKHIPALSANDPKLHLVDALWIFTEPHSRRFKVRLTVRTEVQNVMIQQRVAVELKQQWKQCPDCNREYTNRVSLVIIFSSILSLSTCSYCGLTSNAMFSARIFSLLHSDVARGCSVATETKRRCASQRIDDSRNGLGSESTSSSACTQD